MVKTPKSVEVKVYNVGLGDCILLTFRTSGSKPNCFRVLIDYGFTGKNPDSPDSEKIADQIIGDCGKGNGKPQLDALVVTHRHLDHLSGFGGATGRKLEEGMEPPRLIIQPWTEQPGVDNPHSSAPLGEGASFMLKSIQNGQTAVASILSEIAARRRTNLARETDDEVWFYGSKNLSRHTTDNDASRSVVASSDASHLNETRFTKDAINTLEISNREALERLERWSSKDGCEAEFVSAGYPTKLNNNVIPGLHAVVLGPAGPAHWNELKRAGGQDEYWAKLAGLRSDDQQLNAVKYSEANGPYGVPPIFPAAGIIPNRDARKDNVRWLVKKLDLLRGHQLLGFVRALDSHLNNTSVVLLLTFGKFKMLFPGDAEVGAWRWIAEQGTGPDKPISDSLSLLLADVDLYKVGHHGSNNATPINSLWSHLLHDRRRSHPLHCVLSTQWTRFKGKIPNRDLWRTIQDSKALRLVSTSGPPDSIDVSPALKPPSNKKWNPEPKDGKIIAYSRVFKLN